MFIRVLGSAAGGGFPQWNCNCKNCSSVREGKEGFKARTQSSIAVSSNQEDWLLFNASPDILPFSLIEIFFKFSIRTLLCTLCRSNL